ncbi:hypothetical protein LTR85_005234 [Meristemomyces frigidus]|nr:hypothetical protein LTR85_005234 [Meristemomyces frigidus]
MSDPLHQPGMMQAQEAMETKPADFAETTEEVGNTKRHGSEEAEAPRAAYGRHDAPLDTDDDEATELTNITDIGKQVAKMLKGLHIKVCRMKIASVGADDRRYAANRRIAEEEHARAYDRQLAAVQHEDPVRRARRLFEMFEGLWGEREALRRSWGEWCAGWSGGDVVRIVLSKPLVFTRASMFARIEPKSSSQSSHGHHAKVRVDCQRLTPACNQSTYSLRN